MLLRKLEVSTGSFFLFISLLCIIKNTNFESYWIGTHERAQVVRLDSRWVRMLRFNLGTSFEDEWIPASGETDAHLDNTLWVCMHGMLIWFFALFYDFLKVTNFEIGCRPTQGFIEITIKDLENVLHLQISKVWSLNLLDLFSKSNASFEYKKNIMTKRGDALKVDDLVKLRVDKDGRETGGLHTWRVTKMEPHETVHHEVNAGMVLNYSTKQYKH